MLTENTQTLLKSLIPLNNSMVIAPEFTGSDEFKSITFLADLTKLEDDIPEFGIFDMSNFLSAIELLENPEIKYDSETKRIKASDANTSLEYITSDPSSLENVQVNPKVIKSTLNAKSVLETEITKDILAKIKKTASVFKNFDTLNISTENGNRNGNGNEIKLSVSSHNTFSKNNNSWSLKLEGNVDKEFNVAISLESVLKLPAMDYSLQVKYNEERDTYRVVMTNNLITFVISTKSDF